MTDPDRDRGAYTPSGDGPLAFDARESRERGAGRPPTTLILSALILLILVLALVFWYSSGVRRSGAPPVVGAPISDIKQAPPASAQPADAAAGLQIYSAEQAPAASSAPPTFTPPPEQPLPRLPAGQAAGPPTPPAPGTPPAPSNASAPPAPPAPENPSAPVAAAPKALASADAGGPLVQIGAFSSPALADKGWNDIARLLPGDMIGKTKKVESVSKDSSTLYRAYIGGFSSKAEATSFCDELKAANHVCFVK
jgi:cell division protein FtsN